MEPNMLIWTRRLLLAALLASLTIVLTPNNAQAENPGLAVLYFDYTGQDHQLTVLK